jgi:hypothetical protein
MENLEADSIKNWERKYFTQPLNNPFGFYVIYGNFSADINISDGVKIRETLMIPTSIINMWKFIGNKLACDPGLV